MCDKLFFYLQLHSTAKVRRGTDAGKRLNNKSLHAKLFSNESLCAELVSNKSLRAKLLSDKSLCALVSNESLCAKQAVEFV